jgi:glycosyltransferase involved in cell wall biosynthesis
LILKSYLRHFDYVHYIGPSDQEFVKLQGSNSRIYYSCILYGKSIRERVKYLLKYKKNKSKVKAILNLEENATVQLRLPGLFPLLTYSAVKNSNLPLTTYISIDWPASFKANYKFPGNGLVSFIVDKLQRVIINNSIPVATGPAISQKYSNHIKCYPYFSTSHNNIYRKPIINYPPNKLLYVGSLEPRKRVEDIISALKILMESNNDWQLTIVGKGAMKEKLIEMITEFNLSNKVDFLGQVNDSERLKDIYLDHDILVLPSLSEGTPKVVAEAMAHGVIPLATRGVGSNNYIITDRRNGFLLNKLDPKDIAKKCSEIQNDEELFNEMIKNGYEYAQKHTLNNEVDNMWKHIFSEIR